MVWRMPVRQVPVRTRVRRAYLSGECGAFAAALADMTGWRPVVVTGLFLDEAGRERSGHIIHAALEHPQGGYADAEGRVDVDRIATRYGYDRVETRASTTGELGLLFGFEQREVRAARRAIRLYARNGDLFFASVVAGVRRSTRG